MCCIVRYHRSYCCWMLIVCQKRQRDRLTNPNCFRTDEACLCSHQGFSVATFQCAVGVCNSGDISNLGSVLGLMCASREFLPVVQQPFFLIVLIPVEPTTTKSSSSTSGTSTATTLGSSSSSGDSSSSTSQTTTTSGTTQTSSSAAAKTTTTSATGLPSHIQSSSTIVSGSTTVVVVQTLPLPDPTETSGGSHLDFKLVVLATIVANFLVALSPFVV